VFWIALQGQLYKIHGLPILLQELQDQQAAIHKTLTEYKNELGQISGTNSTYGTRLNGFSRRLVECESEVTKCLVIAQRAERRTWEEQSQWGTPASKQPSYSYEVASPTDTGLRHLYQQKEPATPTHIRRGTHPDYEPMQASPAPDLYQQKDDRVFDSETGSLPGGTRVTEAEKVPTGAMSSLAECRVWPVIPDDLEPVWDEGTLARFSSSGYQPTPKEAEEHYLFFERKATPVGLKQAQPGQALIISDLDKPCDFFMPPSVMIDTGAYLGIMVSESVMHRAGANLGPGPQLVGVGGVGGCLGRTVETLTIHLGADPTKVEQSAYRGCFSVSTTVLVMSEQVAKDLGHQVILGQQLLRKMLASVDHMTSRMWYSPTWHLHQCAGLKVSVPIITSSQEQPCLAAVMANLLVPRNHLAAPPVIAAPALHPGMPQVRAPTREEFVASRPATADRTENHPEQSKLRVKATHLTFAITELERAGCLTNDGRQLVLDAHTSSNNEWQERRLAQLSAKWEKEYLSKKGPFPQEMVKSVSDQVVGHLIREIQGGRVQVPTSASNPTDMSGQGPSSAVPPVPVASIHNSERKMSRRQGSWVALVMSILAWMFTTVNGEQGKVTEGSSEDYPWVVYTVLVVSSLWMVRRYGTGRWAQYSRDRHLKHNLTWVAVTAYLITFGCLQFKGWAGVAVDIM
jgi:hypothetical protein